MRKQLRLVGTGLSILAMLSLAACAPSAKHTVDTGTDSSVVTDPAKMGTVTLQEVDFWQGAEGKWMQDSIAAFEKKYPNITVERTVKDWSSIMDTLTLRLDEPGAPDVVTVNNGWQSMGRLAKGGLIVNLDPYADAYKWRDFIPSTILRQEQFTTDGKTMGEGSMWAAPSARVQNIGIYYNKKLIQQLGLNEPTTLDEFEQVCAAAKSAGLTAIAYGQTDKPIAPLFALSDVLGNKDAISDAVYGKAGTDLGTTGLGLAAQRFSDWEKKGWVMANYQGLSSTDANAKFLAGKAVFAFYYSGLVPTDQKNRQDFGYLQLPQAADNKTMVATGAPADNLAIGIRSEHKDAAALFLDFLMSKDAAQITADHGYMPSLHDVTIPQDDALIVQEATAAQQTEADNGYVPYFDWTTPTMLDTAASQMQLVLAGKSTPDGLVAAVQKDFDAFVASNAK